MAKGGNIMNKLIYKGYVIEVKEKMYLVKNHIDNHFSKQDKKNGRI